jgi:hypothetical protein
VWSKEFPRRRVLHPVHPIFLELDETHMGRWKIVSWEFLEPEESSPEMWLWLGAQAFGGVVCAIMLCGPLQPQQGATARKWQL